MPVFEQSIQIPAPLQLVDRCVTEPDLMQRWLNPLLKCESIGPWSVAAGSRFRFIIGIPWLKPTLDCVVSERRENLVVWCFTGFFEGSDRWECVPETAGTLLINRFTFEIPNPLLAAGFNLTAAALTQRDMQDQLKRLRDVAVSLRSS